MVSESKTRQSRTRCVHHWLIEAPGGRESTGTCKRCGKKRSFANSTESVMWERTNTLRADLASTIRIPRPSEIRLSDEN